MGRGGKAGHVQTVENRQSSTMPAQAAEQLMASILYLLVSEDKSIFKIGITDDLESRYGRLRKIWGDFDLDASCTVTGARSDISRLEKTLHFFT